MFYIDFTPYVPLCGPFSETVSLPHFFMLSNNSRVFFPRRSPWSGLVTDSNTLPRVIYMVRTISQISRRYGHVFEVLGWQFLCNHSSCAGSKVLVLVPVQRSVFDVGQRNNPAAQSLSGFNPAVQSLSGFVPQLVATVET